MTAASDPAPWSDDEIRSKVGQLFIVGFDDIVPNEDVKRLITKHKVGSIVLFQRNISSASQLLDLTRSLQDIAKSSGQSQNLLIGIDQENGLVTRIKDPIAAQLPGSMALGATGDASNAFKVASATAATLKAFGINMNYAPIADINTDPKNPVIGVRSPSDDPEMVGRFVSAQIKGLREGGVIPCAKHFPGHGDTAVDSHYGLPIITKSKPSMNMCELVPFRRAVGDRVESIMTAHIALPGLSDPKPGEKHSDLPASLSPDAINILRERMKYDGLIISDCLEMDGVRATYGTEKGAVMALKAGTDCVMICHTLSAQVGAIEQVVEAVKSGELSQEAIQASVNRVTYLKTTFLSLPSGPAPTLAELEATKSQQAELAGEMYAKSTTLVRSDPGCIPLPQKRRNKIVFLSPGKAPLPSGVVDSGIEKTREPYTPAAFIEILRRHVPSVKDVRFFDSVPLDPESVKAIAEADTVILATRNATLSPYQKITGLLMGRKLGNKLIVVATCDPYDFRKEALEIKNYITIYEPTYPAFKAAVDVIFGVTKPQGTLPVGYVISKHHVRIYEGTDTDLKFVWKLWHELLPSWPIEIGHLQRLLDLQSGQHFVHEHGFCIAFLTSSGMGKIACVAVSKAHQGKGIGTTLMARAQEQLRGMACMVGLEDLQSLSIGSVFPRFWPGVPIDFPQNVKDFFLHRGFRKHTTPTARDLFRDIRFSVAPPAVLERVSKLDLTFKPWSPDLYQECMAKQRANFAYNHAWVQAYQSLAAANQHHEVMVAFLPDGSQVGWTLMASASSIIGEKFAFLPLLPSKEKTGLIACVGVDKSARGKGIGLALLVKAMENMRQRGMEGVCIDWVVIRGFYETLGFEPIWEYEGYDW